MSTNENLEGLRHRLGPAAHSNPNIENTIREGGVADRKRRTSVQAHIFARVSFAQKTTRR